ncbi:AraC family transcriptional regulator [Micromonospora siamensis]|uniref:AraC-type DNA-binding protein n=1 Tax=Micromonospora siamensis TaxID=299152 RepID=A0A1C5I910_9ACTN|nr:AraC family transcriptional regulator [Micromonospora siamensis]SCG54880.1 AraC-type DNA-binding protein [Micromonospora siamensis]
MDPLADVLAMVGATSRISAALAAGGRWAVRFAPPAGVKFNAVRRGGCLLRVDGVPEPITLAEGDCYLLTRPLGFTLASDLDTAPEPAEPLFRAAVDGVARAGAGTDLFLVGGAFSFTERGRDLLLDALPPVIHVPAATPAAATLRWAVAEIDAELRTSAPAAGLVAEHLAMVMLIRILRLHLARSGTSGWLAGLADPVVAPALRAMHAAPAHPWTVAELARVAAVSRSTLAARFKQVVGRGPLDYLTGWRIELAADRIRRGDGTLAGIARAVGYGSESALSVAFKRSTGRSPRDYRASVARST